MARRIESLTDNLAEPLLFNTADSLNFCKLYVCSECLTHSLQPKYFSYDKYRIYCTVCAKVLMEGEYVHYSQLPTLVQNMMIGMNEMKDKPKERKSTEDILKELGYD